MIHKLLLEDPNIVKKPSETTHKMDDISRTSVEERLMSRRLRVVDDVIIVVKEEEADDDETLSVALSSYIFVRQPLRLSMLFATIASLVHQ